jgi:endonuclease YncB( thermonuclease family)
MADVVFVPRNRWRRARWRIAGTRNHALRPLRAPLRHLWRLAQRTWGIVAFSGLLLAVLALNRGVLQDVTGVRMVERVAAVAIDGDSLRTGATDIRLIGIDAPELSQTCRDGHARVWACGSEAHQFLRSLAVHGSLDCTSSGRDRHGRMLATCSTQDVPDIGAAMVRAGFAVSFMSSRYRSAEIEARSNKRGLWRGTFDQPQAWRRGSRHAG